MNRVERELTVVIPNYNHAAYLETAIASILEQTLRPGEIIVVDDASTDDSREVLKRIRQDCPLLRTVLLPQNGGVSQARNRGIRETRTAYITFLDADDYYCNSRKLEMEMALLRQQEKRHGEALAYSAAARVSADGKQLYAPEIGRGERIKFLRGKAKLQVVSLFKPARMPRDYILRKDVLLAAGAYAHPVDFYEDWDLLMRLAMRGVRFCCTFQYGTAYRMTPGGLSQRSEAEHKRAVAQLSDAYLARLHGGEKTLCAAMRWAGRVRNRLRDARRQANESMGRP